MSLPDPSKQFDEIAFLYDELMGGVPYAEWAAYVRRILRRFKVTPKSVLDLCCGTGSVAEMLAANGLDVWGVDISPEMIEIARRKAAGKGLKIEYSVHNASSFRLGRKFDLVVSLFDSLNYITDSSELQNVFYRVSEHLNEGGLFVFDVNTAYAFSEGLFTQSNVGRSRGLLYDWRSVYDEASGLCMIEMVFIRRGERVNVTHYQRAYSEGELIEMLAAAGIQPVGAYCAYSFRATTGDTDRAYFVARKSDSLQDY